MEKNKKCRLMKRTLFCLAMVACLGFAQGADASAVVSWGGNYVTASTDLGGRGGDYTVAGAGLWVYTGAASRSSPVAPGYTGSPFYWGAYLVRGTGDGSASVRNFSNVDVMEGSPDTLRFLRANSGGVTSYTGAAFVSFLKSDFLNGHDTGSFTFGSLESLSVTTSYALLTGYRFAILSGGSWYLSEAAKTPLGSNTPDTLTLSGAALADSQWAAWSPTGGANSRLGALPGSFGVDGSAFTDIQGFGVFMEINPAAIIGQTSGIQISSFQVVAVPEPGSLALAGGGILASWLVRRRRC